MHTSGARHIDKILHLWIWL